MMILLVFLQKTSVLIVLLGIGLSMTYVPQLLVILAACPTRFPLMWGIVFVGGSFGMMVCPPVVELLGTAYGWRGAMMVVAAVNVNAFALGLLQRLPHPVYTRLTTSDADHQPNRLDTSRSKRADVFSLAAKWLFVNLCVEEPKVLLHLSLWPLQGMLFASWMVFLVPHTIARGIPSSTAVFMSTVGGIGHLLGRVVTVTVLDRKLVSAFWAFVLFNLVNTVAFFLDYVAMDYYLVSLSKGQW